MTRSLMPATVTLSLVLFTAPILAADSQTQRAQQWRVTELSFTAASAHPDPFDFRVPAGGWGLGCC